MYKIFLQLFATGSRFNSMAWAVMPAGTWFAIIPIQKLATSARWAVFSAYRTNFDIISVYPSKLTLKPSSCRTRVKIKLFSSRKANFLIFSLEKFLLFCTTRFFENISFVCRNDGVLFEFNCSNYKFTHTIQIVGERVRANRQIK